MGPGPSLAPAGPAAGWSLADKGDRRCPGQVAGPAGKFRSHVPGGRRKKALQHLTIFLAQHLSCPSTVHLKQGGKCVTPSSFLELFQRKRTSKKGC